MAEPEHLELIRALNAERERYKRATESIAAMVLKIERHQTAITVELADVKTRLTGINGFGELIDA